MEVFVCGGGWVHISMRMGPSRSTPESDRRAYITLWLLVRSVCGLRNFFLFASLYFVSKWVAGPGQYHLCYIIPRFLNPLRSTLPTLTVKCVIVMTSTSKECWQIDRCEKRILIEYQNYTGVERAERSLLRTRFSLDN